MTEFPAWLAPHVPAPARHPGLAIAKLGAAQLLARGGFALTSPVAAVPEPETYALLLAGLGLIGMAARRRT